MDTIYLKDIPKNWNGPPVEESSEPGYIKHVVCNHARFHALSYEGRENGNARIRCSEPNCIVNKERTD